MLKHFIPILLFGLMTSCKKNEFLWSKDFRKGSSYEKTQIVFDHVINGKGTILLVHGTAPQNINGEIAVPDVHRRLKEKDPKHYIISSLNRDLASHLNARGWNTVRYTRVGVYDEKTDFHEYGNTDLKNLVTQLKNILEMIPKNRPKIIFAWSGGSVHALQLPLEKVDALILLVL